MRQIAKHIAAAALVVLDISGCSWIMGESFVNQKMRNSQTGDEITCVGHEGRGEPSKSELDEMNECVAHSEAEGYVRE